MARQGDALENPVTGERLVFRRTTTDSGGAVLSFDYFLRAGGSVPLAHVHPRQEERFAIVSGRARIRVGRRLRRASAGESVVVPRGSVHRLWNDGEDELHVLVEFRPALRTEEGFEQLFGLGRDGKLSRRGFPHPLQIAVMGQGVPRRGTVPARAGGRAAGADRPARSDRCTPRLPRVRSSLCSRTRPPT
jgi:mannose-6-phosphate isomerase-like protein (cupin superfamily)